jgi:hypothetical protein
MKLIITLLAVFLVTALPLPSALAILWCAGIAILHAREEYHGRLWDYFGRSTDNQWVAELGKLKGFLLIVLPALALQLTASWMAFRYSTIQPAPFWLGLLIGARLGDALFSHGLPTLQGRGGNPGLPTALIYHTDGLLLLVLFHVPLMASPAEAWAGALGGAFFFYSVLPLMRLTRNFQF